ncbi:MAG TPA: hypothetical protein VNO14_17710, partial [Blastocatellia bacterium]|nr:hypothetical protein [Blastocatellia bacterium]
MRIPPALRAASALFLCWTVLVTAEARLALGTFAHTARADARAIDDSSGKEKSGKDDKDKNDKSDKSSREMPPASGEGPGGADEEKKKPSQKQEQLLPSGATIIVEDRALAGPFSTPQLRGNRAFLPLASIARSLGDQVAVNPVARTVEVRRQTGDVAEFDARLKQVRENGAVILVVSDT